MNAWSCTITDAAQSEYAIAVAFSFMYGIFQNACAPLILMDRNRQYIIHVCNVIIFKCQVRILSFSRLGCRLVPSCSIKEARPVVVTSRSTDWGLLGGAGFESIVEIGSVKVVALLGLECSWRQSGS